MVKPEAPDRKAARPGGGVTPTPEIATEPPRGTEPGDGEVVRYAAMNAIPRESVGEGAEIPAKISNPDKRMWSGRVSTETTGDDTPIALR
jgi:hypothetical protein